MICKRVLIISAALTIAGIILVLISKANYISM